jgi:hypothetical protein
LPPPPATCEERCQAAAAAIQAACERMGGSAEDCAALAAEFATRCADRCDGNAPPPERPSCEDRCARWRP